MKQITAQVLVIAAALLFVSAAATSAAAQTRAFNTVPVRTLQGIPVPDDSAGSILIGPNVNITNKSGPQSETGVAIVDIAFGKMSVTLL